MIRGLLFATTLQPLLNMLSYVTSDSCTVFIMPSVCTVCVLMYMCRYMCIYVYVCVYVYLGVCTVCIICV